MDLDGIASDWHKILVERINEELERVLSSRVGLVEEIGNYALQGRGKRLRPLLFVLSCQLCHYQGEDIYRLSTIFEYLHTASLLHDDVLDNAEVRRNKPTANHLWGNQAAVLEGDYLASRSSLIAADSNNLMFVKAIADISSQMAEGQILELLHTHDWSTTREAYMKIIRAKTAALLSAACGCGAIISGANSDAEQSLSRFGLNVGVAFQLMDDLLDYTSSEEEFGKPVGKDLREGKITLPLIYTLEKLEASEISRLGDLFAGDRVTQADYQDLIDRVRQNGALDQIRQEAQSYVDKAATNLRPFPDSPAKKNLLELSQYIVERKY